MIAGRAPLLQQQARRCAPAQRCGLAGSVRRVVPFRRNLRPLSAVTDSDLGTAAGGEDFYSLLGVSPQCSSVEVKAAYRSLMRDLHPDLALASQDEEMQSQAHTLAVLLNEIYDTLMDEEKRATYNALSGFATDNSINPFEDTSFPRDQAFVDEVSCIGCGKCVRACQNTFEIEDSLYGRARVFNQNGDDVEDIQIATEVCPVTCIHWVTLPQLSLLEVALAQMPRIDAFILQRSGGAGGNVFWEAYKAYERRRLAINEKAVAAANSQQSRQRSGFTWPMGNAAGSSSMSQHTEEMRKQQQRQEPQPATGEERRIMNLAAIAAALAACGARTATASASQKPAWSPEPSEVHWYIPE
eukprot:CAMPEP_0202371258 /NCGR_PEP_ID=MMETSP1127-20130417/2690_1 /ASSEMBLY_ACC=CAM_ASM_000462 /TAXON_ID=3047 /ORGANISM="Dunaliella tertiolecta, Strain CCMP1320" /LENGTH=355 /DNA_ID=CAMNT_0048967441 /DNA_START=1391 /DNA_END=2459 /DNA_ORIENTATION=-